MILICDSGSTKSDWVLLKDDAQIYFSTNGLNPTFHDQYSVEKEIRLNTELIAWNDQVTNIYFYGAGCSSDEKKALIFDGIQKVFPKAKIQVENDLLAAAYATYSGKPGISCILGTGSNACLFDGNKMYQNIPALGFILGDEGSGTYLGKRLLADYFYKRLPFSMEEALRDEFGLTKESVVERVYRQPNANAYLASFVPFLLRFANEDYVQRIVKEGFSQFLSIHVSTYQNSKELLIHFVGSVAYFFQNELKQVAQQHDLMVGNIIQKPIEGLITYHKTYLGV